jgi:hypothetical protein
MTQIKYKRRTFKDVEAAGYARGWKECREKFEADYDDVVDANIDLSLTVTALQTKLDNVSLRKLAWSRITGLFRSRHDRVA